MKGIWSVPIIASILILGTLTSIVFSTTHFEMMAFAQGFDLTELKAYYKFDELTGNLINVAGTAGSTDSLGSIVDGQLEAGVTQGQSGIIGSSYSFDGTSSGQVILGTSKSAFNFMHNSKTMTWSTNFWIKPTPSSVVQCIFGNEAGATTRIGVDGSYFGSTPTGKVSSFITVGLVGKAVVAGNSGSSLPIDNQFHMVTITYDQTLSSNNQRFYVDGVLTAVNSKQATLPNPNDATHVMELGSCGFSTLPSTGNLDEFSIWNRVLTAAEVGQLFNNGNGLPLEVSPAFFLILDEDSIDNGIPPNFFSDVQVNDDIADIGLRTQLPFFAANVGETITLHTGEVGDEGWFALKKIPTSWEGLDNFILAAPPIGDSEDLLDKIEDVTPLRFTGLKMLEGERVCAVVYDSDISINYDPLNGNLKGANLGTVAFEVLDVKPLTGFSSSSLPEVDVEILDAEEVCEGALGLFTDAPEPTSSSEPFDVEP